MDQAADDCLSEDLLLGCMTGSLAPDAAERVRAHLLRCAHCLAVVKELSEQSDAGAGSRSGAAASLLAAQVVAPPAAASISSGWSPPASFEEFRLLRLLGQGGMGQVWLGQDVLLDRPVAVKFIASGEPAAAARERFLLEARAIARLTHPNVVTIHRIGEVDGRPFLVSELVAGQSLAVLAKPVSWEQALRVGLGLSRGLAAAHAQGVLHRDIKPANVMLQPDGEVKLLDFGLAKLLDALALSQGAEHTGAIVGTPRYMAPEVLRGQPASRRSDVYSVGLVLYELCTGALPWDARRADGRRVAPDGGGEVPPLATACPGVSPHLATLIDRCVAHDPAARPSSGEELRLALELLTPTAELLAMPEGTPYRGLHFFDVQDRALFYGREALTTRLWAAFVSLHGQESAGAPRVLPILGPSGSGKSSLVRAGLVPELLERDVPGLGRARVAPMVPGGRPVEALARTLARLASDDATPVSKIREFLGVLSLRDEQQAWSGLRLIVDTLPTIAEAPLVLIIDAFEEVYSLCPDRDERDLFVANLLHAASARPARLSVVLTMRSDFLGETHRHPLLNRVLAERGVIVPVMSEEELRRAIAEPARRVGRPLSNAVVQLLVAEAVGREGALPLLQFALTRVWEGMREGKDAATTLREIGGVGGALAGKAQEIFDGLSVAEQEIARRAFLGLVQLGEGSQDTRRRVTVAELVAHGERPEQVREVLRRFADAGARLVTLSAGSEGQEVAEVAHEALLGQWGALREWLAEGREDLRFHRRLQDAALRWEELGRPDGLLWRPPDLEILQGFHARRARDMTSLQLELRQASERRVQGEQEAARDRELAELQRERAERRRARRLAASLAGLMTLAILLAGAAFVQRRQAEDRRREAQGRLVQLYEEQGRQYLLAGSPLRALVYLGKAYQHTDNPSLRFMLARAAAAIAPQVGHIVAHPGGVNKAVFDAAAKRILSLGMDHTARVWDTGGRLLVTLKGHQNQIIFGHFSLDGERILTSATDQAPRLWRAATGEPLAVLGPHAGSTGFANFNPSGTLVVTASLDGTARLWDARSGVPLMTLKGHSAPLWFAAFSPDGTRLLTLETAKYSADGERIPVAIRGGTGRLWEVATGKVLHVLAGSSQWSTGGAFSPDGKLLATTAPGNDLRLWDVQDGRLVATLEGHTDPSDVAGFSPQGDRLLTVSWDATARLWDGKTGRPQAVLRGHSGPVVWAVFSRDGERVATASNDHTTRLWDARSGAPLATFEGHAGTVYTVEFSPDGTQLVTASHDGTVRLWNTTRVEPLLATLEGHTGAVGSALFSPDGTRIVTGGKDRTARLWDAATGREQKTFTGHTDTIVAATFSPDGTRVVTASQDRTARVWPVIGSERTLVLTGHTGFVGSAVFSSDGSQVLTASADQSARLWDARSGALLHILAGHAGPVESAAFSRDGGLLVTAGGDRAAILWSAATGTVRARLLGHSDAVRFATFSPDGNQVATVSDGSTAKTWDARTGAPQKTMVDRTAEFFSAVFSPDGSRLVLFGGYNDAVLWDLQAGRILGTLTGHSHTIYSAAFSPDGLRVITASGDRTARVWDGRSGKLVFILAGHTEDVFQAAFSPDGARAVTASEDGTAKLWDLHEERRPPAEIDALVRCHVPFRLEDERLVPTSPEPAACR